MDQENEGVQDEDEEEAPARNPGIEIGWFRNTDFYGVNTQQ